MKSYTHIMSILQAKPAPLDKDEIAILSGENWSDDDEFAMLVDKVNLYQVQRFYNLYS